VPQLLRMFWEKICFREQILSAWAFTSISGLATGWTASAELLPSNWVSDSKMAFLLSCLSICFDFSSSADATTKDCYRITWFSDSILDKPVSSLLIISWSWLNFGFSFLCLLWQFIKPFLHLEKLIFKISSLLSKLSSSGIQQWMCEFWFQTERWQPHRT